MKILKNTFTFFLMLFISIGINAQIDDTKTVKKTLPKTVKKNAQDKTCISGDCQNGKGIKEYFWSNYNYKKRYEGSFKSGKYAGQGILKKHTKGDGFVIVGYKLDYEYKGGFVYGRKSGYGEETDYKKKTIYKGNWKFSKKNGKGKLYNLEHQLIKTGIWKNGIYQK